MLIALTMPQFGESITEALIVRWLKKEGESVREQEPLIEMETEKSVFSYESPFEGKLIKVLQGEAKQIAVGTEIAHFEVSDKNGQKYLSLGVGKKVGGGEAPRPESPRTPSGSPVTVSALAPQTDSGRPISPAIRSLAKEKGIPLSDLEKVPGTGPGGRLTKEDLMKHPVRPGGVGVRIITLTPIRARIAEKLTLSKREIHHAGTGVDADVTAIDEWRRRSSQKLVHLPFVLFAVIPALKKFPILNSSLKGKDGDQRIEEYPYVNLGIATATDEGLLVPVLKNADSLSFRQLADEGTKLIEKARSRKLSVDELTGGTFTVNNTGALGAVRSNQIIPHPQSGILALNRVVSRPWVVDGEIKVRSIMSLDLSFDHRIVDGDAACGFLNEVKKNLENFDFSIVG